MGLGEAEKIHSTRAFTFGNETKWLLPKENKSVLFKRHLGHLTAKYMQYPNIIYRINISNGIPHAERSHYRHPCWNHDQKKALVSVVMKEDNLSLELKGWY